MMSLPDDKQADIIDAFYTTSNIWKIFLKLITFILLL